MRHLLLIIAIVSALFVYKGHGQDIDSPKPFVLHLSHDSDPGSLWINFFMTGPFGGYGSFVRTSSTTWDYEIPVSNEGKPANKMRLIVNSSKYKTRVFDFPALKTEDRVIDLKLEPRSTLPFTGKISSQHRLSEKKLQIRISFMESWLCEYFGVIDCLGIGKPITSVDLDRDGRFTVDLPDFASDPVIASFHDKGAFQFFLHDRKTGNILYRLRPENGSKGLGEVPVASSYSTEQLFVAERFE